MLLFVRTWFAPSERARANGVWQLAYPFAAMLSGPIAGYVTASQRASASLAPASSLPAPLSP